MVVKVIISHDNSSDKVIEPIVNEKKKSQNTLHWTISLQTERERERFRTLTFKSYSSKYNNLRLTVSDGVLLQQIGHVYMHNTSLLYHQIVTVRDLTASGSTCEHTKIISDHNITPRASTCFVGNSFHSKMTLFFSANFFLKKFSLFTQEYYQSFCPCSHSQDFWKRLI